MAAIDPDVIQSLVASVEVLIHQARRLPDTTRAIGARAALEEARAGLPTDVGGLSVGSWTDLGEDAQRAIRDKLETLQNDLGFRFPHPDFGGSRMLMSAEPTPTWVILLLLLLAVLGTAFVLSSIVGLWNEALQGTGSPTQRQSAFALARDRRASLPRSRRCWSRRATLSVTFGA